MRSSHQDGRRLGLKFRFRLYRYVVHVQGRRRRSHRVLRHKRDSRIKRKKGRLIVLAIARPVVIGETELNANQAKYSKNNL